MLFFLSKIDLGRPGIRRRIAVDTLKTRLSLCLLAAVPTLVFKPPLPVSPPYLGGDATRVAGSRHTGPRSTLFASSSRTLPPMLLKEYELRSLAAPSPSPSSRIIVLLNMPGKKLLILCTRVPSLTLRISALLYGFDHVQLNLAYLTLRGYHLHGLLQSQLTH